MHGTENKTDDPYYSTGSTPFYETIIGVTGTPNDLYDNSLQEDTYESVVLFYFSQKKNIYTACRKCKNYRRSRNYPIAKRW